LCLRSETNPASCFECDENRHYTTNSESSQMSLFADNFSFDVFSPKPITVAF
jgi:hypothetical protein